MNTPRTTRRLPLVLFALLFAPLALPACVAHYHQHGHSTSETTYVAPAHGGESVVREREVIVENTVYDRETVIVAPPRTRGTPHKGVRPGNATKDRDATPRSSDSKRKKGFRPGGDKAKTGPKTPSAAPKRPATAPKKPVVATPAAPAVRRPKAAPAPARPAPEKRVTTDRPNDPGTHSRPSVTTPGDATDGGGSRGTRIEPRPSTRRPSTSPTGDRKTPTKRGTRFDRDDETEDDDKRKK